MVEKKMRNSNNSNSTNKILTIFLFLLIAIAPGAMALDANPTVTYFTHTYLSSLSQASFYGGASDYGDNAGMKKIVLYEDSAVKYTKWCNTLSTSCDLSYTITYATAQTHTYRIRAWDKYDHASAYSSTRTVTYGGTNHAPDIVSHTPTTNPSVSEG
ncbi:MAG: hypothetical protein KJ574_04260, partial [Nanoarchaeota archaeon]|nr:hypothetical protein [Nanoarchaeota archaeon]